MQTVDCWGAKEKGSDGTSKKAVGATQERKKVVTWTRMGQCSWREVSKQAMF